MLPPVPLPRARTVLLASGAFGLAVFCYEHVGRKRNWRYRPTYFIDKVAEQSRDVFEALGRLVGFLSGYLWWFNVAELIDTAWALIISFGKFLISASYVFVGYAKKATEYANPTTMAVGTGLLVGALLAYVTHRHWDCAWLEWPFYPPVVFCVGSAVSAMLASCVIDIAKPYLGGAAPRPATATTSAPPSPPPSTAAAGLSTTSGDGERRRSGTRRHDAAM